MALVKAKQKILLRNQNYTSPASLKDMIWLVLSTEYGIRVLLE